MPRFRAVSNRLRSLALILPALIGCSGYVQKHIAQGDRYFNEQKFRESIEEYGKAIRFDGDNVRAVRQLGLAHFRLGELQDAYAYLSKSELLQPSDVQVRLHLANIYLVGQRPDDAIKETNAVLALDPKNTDAMALMAAAYLNKRQPANATEAYRRIVALEPTNPLSHYLLGLGLLAEGKNDDGRRELEIASSSGKVPVAQGKLVELDLTEHKTDAALARAKQFLAANPTSGQASFLLGAVHAARNDRAGAEAAYLEAIRLEPKLADAHVALGELYANGGDTDKGIAHLNEALRVNPPNAKAATALGVIYQQKGDFERARQFYERALGSNARFGPAANNLAWLLSERLGDNARALQLSTIAHDELPNDPHVSDTYGRILYKSGDFTRAFEVLRAAAAQLPDNAAVQYHLGVAAQRVGNAAVARQALTRAAGATTESPERDSAKKVLGAMK